MFFRISAGRILLALMMNAGCALAQTTDAHSPKRPAATTPSSGSFADITRAAGIDFKHENSATSQKYLLETMGSGVALFDYDNDGRLDIFFVNGAEVRDPMPKGAMPDKSASKYWNRLYHQKKDGSFEDVTTKAGVAGQGYGMGVAVGDYDNDGFEDLYVTAFGHNTLYHNNGNGTFTDVTNAAGVGSSGWSTSAAWVDLDQDGKLDLVVARYLDWSFDSNLFCGEHLPGHRAYCHPDVFKSIKPVVFHNNGDGTFTDVTEKCGINNSDGKGLGIAIADYDNDGKIDVFIANDSTLQTLYHNLGGGTFAEVALDAGVAVDGDGRTYAGMGVDFADYNNDAKPDLIITNLSNQRYALYDNIGDGTFRYSTFDSGIGELTLLDSGWGIRFFDFDNDGWKDLIVAQGHVLDTIQLTFPQLNYKQRPLLARNTGKKFVDVSATAGPAFQQAWVGRGLAIGDIDNDGRLDVVITTNNGPAYLLHNQERNPNHWLGIKLVGTRSNRDGIGAEVGITDSQGRAQHATVSTSASYLSSSDKRLHFGLGAETTLKNVTVRWPSGTIQVLENVKADQFLQVTEPAPPAAAGH